MHGGYHARRPAFLRSEIIDDKAWEGLAGTAQNLARASIARGQQIFNTEAFTIDNLRGLAARAPYFHNGTAATLDAAVKFHDTRFHMGLTAQEATDLAIACELFKAAPRGRGRPRPPV
jgi:cytochrome c peroxidase